MLVFPPSDFSSLDGDSFFFFFSTSCEIEQQECNEETSITINMCTSNTARVIGVCVLKNFQSRYPVDGVHLEVLQPVSARLAVVHSSLRPTLQTSAFRFETQTLWSQANYKFTVFTVNNIVYRMLCTTSSLLHSSQHFEIKLWHLI